VTSLCVVQSIVAPCRRGGSAAYPGRAPPTACARVPARAPPGRDVTPSPLATWDPDVDPVHPRDVGPRCGIRRDLLAGAPTMGGGHVNAAPRRLAAGSAMLVIGEFLKFPEYWDCQERAKRKLCFLFESDTA